MALLATGLGRAGAEVSCFPCEATRGSEALALSQAFERANEFDLIHSFLGERALVCAALVRAPLLSTIDGAPSADFARLCARLQGRAWFVATHAAARSSDVDVLAIIAPAERDQQARLAGEYLAVYARVLEKDSKRRADSGHDRRPWGEYRVLIDDPRFKVKRIDVLAGKRLSYQRHGKRSEHWAVVSGQARVTLDGKIIELGEGGTVEIPIGAAHRVENPGPGPLTFIEVQRGSYFGEDDIERLSDDFGRA